jgi:hypothetical protein
MMRKNGSGMPMRRAWLWLSISLLITIGLLLPDGTVGAGDPIPTPTPVSKRPAHTEVLPADLQAAPPPEFDGQRPYIHLTSYTFDPLSEATPYFLSADLALSGYPAGEEGYYLLQFQGPIQPAWKEAIVAAGAQILDYIPDFAFVVKMDDATKATVEAMDAVRWVGLYQPGYRIAPSLMNAPASAEDVELVDVMVIVFKGEDTAALADRLQEMGGTIHDVTETHWKGKIRVQIPRSQLNTVAHLSGVKWIEPSPEWKLLNNEAADILGVREVWDTHGLHGAGQTVAVCDTGLDQGSTSPGSLHDDFEDGSGSSRVMTIYDRVGDGADDVNNGHGTHVAGSVLGNGDRSGSTPSSHTYPSTAYVGMAPEASLVFQAVEQNSTGYLTGIPSDLNILFNQVLGDGARIHTNSWGSAVAGAYTSSSEDVDEFMWDHKDFTILFAAGNEGIDSDADGVVDLYSMDSPGTAKNCITVGASENDRSSGGYNPGGACSTWGNCWPTDFSSNPIRDDRLSDDPTGMAAFSSRGPALDGRFKPDVVAPGTNIASVRSSVASGSGWGTINSYYMYMGGTSMATPLVAGTAALVRDFYTDIKEITPSAALIKATLINGATDISPGQYGTGGTQEIPDPPRPNDVEGWGRVNVGNAIFPAAPRELIFYDETPGLITDEDVEYSFEVTDSSEPLRVTLAWSDYPGSPAAAGGLVNDLDLSVTAPGGTVYYPNNASQRGTSQHLYYDDGVPNGGYTWSAGIRVAVRFTPNSYPATLDKAQFLLASASSSYPKTFNYYVYDGDTSGPDTVLASGSTTIRQAGWHVVDLSGSGVTVNSGDFFLAIGLPDSDLLWAYDSTAPIDNRSWDYAGGIWTQWTGNDYMFRAVVTGTGDSTSFDRVNNVVGVDIGSPATGVYTITVQGYNVPHGPQPYALVASGAITGASNSPPGIAGLPDQMVPKNGSANDAIDLWDYASDTQDSDSDLIFTISNSPDPNAGVTIDSNRYIDINPVFDWTGTTDVEVQVEDTGSLTDTDSFQVTVGFPSPPFCDGFESGSLGAVWTTYTTNEGQVQVSSSYSYSGTYSVLLDDSADNSTYSHAAIILTIDLSAQSDVELDFWWRDFGDEDHDDDGVFVSDDWGTTWFTATNFTGSQSSFKNEVIDVDAIAGGFGLTLNDHFQIKFQFYDNYSIASDGYAIDEVCVQVPSIPNIGVSPASLEETVHEGERVTKTLTINNTGTDPLTFGIRERPGGFAPTVVALSTADTPEPAAPKPAVEQPGGFSNLFSIQSLEGKELSKPAAPQAIQAAVNLVLDDGSIENALGVNSATNSVQFIWLNRFTPNPSEFPFTLDEIWMLFDSFGGAANINVGDAIDLVVYEDADGDPSNGATWMATFNETVQAVDGTTWNVYTLTTPLLLNGPGDVLIAAINRYITTGVSPVAFPASFDESSSSQNRSWLGWYSTDPPDPAILPPNTSFSIQSGNFTIRGYGSLVPEDVPWLSEEPISGTVSASGSLPVDVIFDATGLALGNYTADLVIYNNDPDENPVTVPVTMVVVPCIDVTGVDLTLLASGDIYTDTFVQFSANISPNDASKPYNYSIDYDDGTAPVTGTNSDDPLAFSHTFATSGIHIVEIAVGNCDMTAIEAKTDTVTVTVKPGPAPPPGFLIYLPIVVRNH